MTKRVLQPDALGDEPTQLDPPGTKLMRSIYARAIYEDPAATLDDLRESVETYEQLARTARRVFGGTHPITEGIGHERLEARAALRAREETQSSET